METIIPQKKVKVAVESHILQYLSWVHAPQAGRTTDRPQNLPAKLHLAWERSTRSVACDQGEAARTEMKLLCSRGQ